MVIHQFNKLIRNKWIWGAFAIAISAFFAFDFLVADLGRSSDEPSSSGVGKLGGESVDGQTFAELAEEIRGFGQNRDWRRNSGEVNRQAWETLAALTVAERGNLEATDAEVQAAIRRDPSFQSNGGFSFSLYQGLLRQNGLTPERFERFLKRRLTLTRLGQAVLSSAAWVSPMELDQAVADMTDVLTVRVAKFAQDPKDAAAVKLDDAGLRAWYDDNVKSLELPERVKIRYVRFNATDPLVLARMTVSDDEMHDRYDTMIDRYTSTDTNGVEKVRAFDEVKGEIEKELRQMAAVQFFETNLNYRAYAQKSLVDGSRLDEIAKEDGGLKVQTSGWFALDGSYKPGFTVSAAQVLPGAKDFLVAVAELDSSSEDLRYGVVSSDSAVWLIERAETSAKHTPTFEEAKDAIRPRALHDAQEAAFKAEVEAVAAKGAAAVLAGKDVSTNLTFSVDDLRSGSASFEDQFEVARAAMKLAKGEVSPFVGRGHGKAILVVCEDRVAGDAAKAAVLRSQIRDELAMVQLRQLPESWQKWNLERLGFETTGDSSVEVVEEEK